MRSARILTVLVVGVLLWARSLPSRAAFTQVDRSIRVDATGTACRGARFNRIQSALDAAPPGSKIIVCAGVYREQILVTKRVTLQGLRGAVVRPAGMEANSTSIRTGRPIAAVAVVTGGAKIQGLEFDASQNGVGCGDDAPLLMGVFFRGAGGSLRRSRIHGTRLGPNDRTCESGAGVFVQGTGQAAKRARISDNVIYDYQRAGIVVNEPGARATVLRNTVTGAGPTSESVQNGIQVGFGAVAKIIRNVVQDNAVPSGPGCFFDGGNLIFSANGGLVRQNTFTGNTAGLIVNGNGNRLIGNLVDGLSGGVMVGLDGIAVFGDRNRVVRNRVRNVSEAGIRLAGNGNMAKKNRVAGTRAAALCEAARALPGCSSLLATCGVGLWISTGSGNRIVRNTLSGNDVPVLDGGNGSLVRQRALATR